LPVFDHVRQSQAYVLSLVAAQAIEFDSSDRRLDFGHDDVFRAKSAVALVWEPILGRRQ